MRNLPYWHYQRLCRRGDSLTRTLCANCGRGRSSLHPFARDSDYTSFDDEQRACPLVFLGSHIFVRTLNVVWCQRVVAHCLVDGVPPRFSVRPPLAADSTDHRTASALQDDGTGDGGGFFNAVGGTLSVNGGSSEFQNNGAAVRQTRILSRRDLGT